MSRIRTVERLLRVFRGSTGRLQGGVIPRERFYGGFSGWWGVRSLYTRVRAGLCRITRERNTPNTPNTCKDTLRPPKPRALRLHVAILRNQALYRPFYGRNEARQFSPRSSAQWSRARYSTAGCP